MTMKTRLHTLRSYLPLAGLIAVGLMGAAPARAALLLEVLNSTAAPNSTGNSFDVDLVNTGLSAQNIAGFSFQFSVTDADISFDAVNSNFSTAAPYIFTGDSIAAAFPPFATLSNAVTLFASDLTLSGANVSVGAGATFGLGHIFFNVANGAALGNFAVALAAGGITSLSDSAGAPVDFTPTDGTISISAAAVPEPSYLWVLASVLLIGFVAHRFRVKVAR